MIVVMLLVFGLIVGLGMFFLIPMPNARIHIDAIAGVAGAVVGAILSAPFAPPNEIAQKIVFILAAVVAAIIAVFIARSLKI